MEHWNKICGLITIFLFVALFSAAQTDKSILLPVTRPFTFTNPLLFFHLKNDIAPTLSIKIINRDFYTQHFGFFCKKELAFEKTIKVPLRIRLGSLQQCNYLEGKKIP